MLRHLAIQARATLLCPRRRRKLEQLAVRGRAPSTVLFYHRVADHPTNGWTISREKFQRHIDYCQSKMELVDLAGIQERVRTSVAGRPAVSITFDDGYAENCDFALPLLIQRGVPCTYFVTTENLRRQSPFPHDVAAGQALPVNTVAQIREMSDAGVEIGCHTRTHIDFSKPACPAQVRAEIKDAKDELQQMIGKEVRYFAFPYGLPQQLTRDAIAMVQEAGFEGFCSAFGAYNRFGGDAFHIRRCHGDPEFARLINWLSFDPSKLADEPLIEYPQPSDPKPPSRNRGESEPADSSRPVPIESNAHSSVERSSEPCG